MDILTRREFNFGLVGVLRAPGMLQKLKPTVYGGIEVGVQSYTFRRFSIERMIEAMRSIGIGSVELWNGHLDPIKASEADFKATRNKLDDAGIRVSSYCVNFPVDATDEHLDRGFTGSGLLGTKLMTTSVKKPIVPRLDQWARKYKVTIGLHNHWFGQSPPERRAVEFETPDDFLNALKGASQYLAINLDIGHFHAAGFDPVSFIRENHRRIISLHIKDRDKDEARTQKRFGQGVTPIVEVMKLLKSLKYKGAANIEYEPEQEDPVEGVRDALAYLRRALG